MASEMEKGREMLFGYVEKKLGTLSMFDNQFQMLADQLGEDQTTAGEQIDLLKVDLQAADPSQRVNIFSKIGEKLKIEQTIERKRTAITTKSKIPEYLKALQIASLVLSEDKFKGDENVAYTVLETVPSFKNWARKQKFPEGTFYSLTEEELSNWLKNKVSSNEDGKRVPKIRVENWRMSAEEYLRRLSDKEEVDLHSGTAAGTEARNLALLEVGSSFEMSRHRISGREFHSSDRKNNKY